MVKLISHNITHDMKSPIEKKKNIIKKHIAITDIHIKWTYSSTNTKIYQIIKYQTQIQKTNKQPQLYHLPYSIPII
jgi:hypothetical protein